MKQVARITSAPCRCHGKAAGNSAIHNPQSAITWFRLLISTATIILCLIMPPGVHAQPAVGKVKGGFLVPEYDAQNRKRSLLSGESAEAKSVTLWLVSKLKIEVLGEDEKTTWIVEAPVCLYDYAHKVAQSSTAISARSANGQLAITGEGFEWKQADQHLIISNAVKTLIRQTSGQTNALSGLAKQDLEIRAGRFDFDSRKSYVNYTGGVQVRELTNNSATPRPFKLSSATMGIQLPPGGGGGVQTIISEENVVIEEGTSRVTGTRAVYSATNELVVVTGLARWETEQAEGKGERLVLDRKQNRFEAYDATYTKLRPSLGGTNTTAWFPTQHGSTNEPVEIFADSLIAKLPPAGTRNLEIVAVKEVSIVQGTNRASADHAILQTIGSNSVVTLTGNGRWKTPAASGQANTLIFDQGKNSFKGDGNAAIQLRQAATKTTTDTNLKTNRARFLEIKSARYEFQNGQFNFHDHVTAQDDQWRMATGQLSVKTVGPTNRLERLIAEQGVQLEPISITNGNPWKLTCDRATALGNEKDGHLDSIIAENNLHLEQLKPTANGLWSMDCDRATLHLKPGTDQQIEDVHAEQNVRVVQLGTNGPFLWRLQSGQLDLTMAASNRIDRVTARQNVHLEQGVTRKGPPLKMRCETASLTLDVSNHIDRVIAEDQVFLEQGPSRASGQMITFNSADNEMELKGHPSVTLVETANTKTNGPPQIIHIDGAEQLFWNRLSNKFRGRGPYRITPGGPLPVKNSIVFP
ncbi:MAG: hypothetical protein WCO56_10635 [Verrucomicrobiota bacterium]